jgi:branched-chain amino acid transport system permease protein
VRPPAQLRVPLALLALAPAALLLAAAGVLTQPAANLLAYGAIYAILAISLNQLTGYGGQLSFGHAALLGVGGFTTGIVADRLALPGPAGLPVSLALAILAGGVAALLIGLPALRLRGVYMAIVTFAFADAFENYVFNIQELTGLGSGITVARPFLGPVKLTLSSEMLALALVLLALAWLLDARLLATRPGRALLAIRESEPVAASFGVPVAAEKLRAFVLSGMLAGLAGCLFAYQVQVVTKGSFTALASLSFLIIVVVGGLGARWGVVASAVLFTVLPQALVGLAQWQGPLLAALLIVTLATHPGGLPEQFEKLRERRELRRRGLEPDAAPRAGTPEAGVAGAEPHGGAIVGSRPARLEREDRGETGNAGLSGARAEMLALPGSGAELHVEGVSVSFRGLQAVAGAGLSVPAGAAVGLIGPNGAGKSTLFNVISGFQRADAGRVLLDGRDISRLPPHRRARLGLGRTFQQVGLVQRATVLDNLLLAQQTTLTYGHVAGLLALPRARRQEREARERAAELLEEVGLSAYAGLRVGVLSTGQQRLLELACAVASEPRLLLLDEPSAGMSPAAAEHLAEQLRRLRRRHATGLLLIEHHIPLVLEVCETCFVMDGGEVIASGPVREVVRRPEVVTAYLGEAV